MRFGIYTEMQTAPGKSHATMTWEILRQIEHADQVGFDVYSVIDHHFFQKFSISANPLALFCAAAQRTVPNNPLYPFQAWHSGLIDLPRAWSITTGSAAVLVALVDDGTRFDHPALSANLTSDGYSFVNNRDSLTLCAGGKISNADNGHGYWPDPTIPASYHPDSTGRCFIPSNIGGHGVHVAGTIGAWQYNLSLIHI